MYRLVDDNSFAHPIHLPSDLGRAKYSYERRLPDTLEQLDRKSDRSVGARAVLAAIHMTGNLNQSIDRPKALRLCEQDAINGYAYAQYLVAWISAEEGRMLDASLWMRRSAAQGFPPALFAVLGCLFRVVSGRSRIGKIGQPGGPPNSRGDSHGTSNLQSQCHPGRLRRPPARESPTTKRHGQFFDATRRFRSLTMGERSGCSWGRGDSDEHDGQLSEPADAPRRRGSAPPVVRANGAVAAGDQEPKEARVVRIVELTSSSTVHHLKPTSVPGTACAAATRAKAQGAHTADAERWTSSGTDQRRPAGAARRT